MRTDPHRPGAIIPADYQPRLMFHAPLQSGGYVIPRFNVDEALALYRERGARIHGGIFNCDVCGAHYKEGELWEHAPSGRIISIGHICAPKYELLADHAEYRREKAARIVAAIAAAEAEARAAARAEFLEAHPGLAEALETDHEITRDIRARFERFGDLSPKQVALVFKLAREAAERAAEEAAPVVPAPEGRFEVTGTILGLRDQPGFAYGTITTKMLVRVEAEGGAWKAWGTLPKAIEREAELKGRAVTFTATFERSRKDDGFVFFKRPARASLVAA